MLDPRQHKIHDYFNLIVLPFVCISNILYLSTVSLRAFDIVHWLRDHEDATFSVHYFVFLAYIVVDTTWLACIPSAVVSPRQILMHHLATIYGWALPVMNPQWRVWCSLGVLVEINSWFLMARRQFRSSEKLIPILFYTTWVLLRIVMYPAILFHFFYVYLETSESLGYFTHSGLSLLLLMIALNILNYSWSYDLLCKKRKSAEAIKQDVNYGL